MGHIDLAAVCVAVSGSRKLFAFPIDGKEVLHIATVARAKKGDDGEIVGFQREEVRRHISEIAAYVEKPNAMIPNALVIAFSAEHVSFKSLAGTPGVRYGEFGILRVPYWIEGSDGEDVRSGWIVDGQQRAFAIKGAKVEAFSVMVCAFIEDDPEVQAEQFVNVNSTKALPRTLVNELLPHLRTVPARLTKRRAASLIAQRLADDGDSPFFGLVRTHTVKKGVIQLNSLISPIESMMDSPTTFVGSKVDPDQHLADVEEIVVGLKEYWTAVKSAFPEAWGLRPTESRLMHGAGIWAMMQLMTVVCEHMRVPERAELESRVARLRGHCAWTEDGGDWRNLDGFERTEAWNSLQNTAQDKLLLTRFLVRKYVEEAAADG